jgi:alpha-galactosidase
MTLLHLRAAGVSLLLDARGPGLPSVVHWGTRPGPGLRRRAGRRRRRRRAGGGQQRARRPGPAVAVARAGGRLPRPARPDRQPRRPRLLTGVRARRRGPGRWERRDRRGGRRAGRPGACASSCACTTAGCCCCVHQVRNDGAAPYALDELACVLPVPARAVDLQDLTGRWLRERRPQRHPFVLGAFLREQRRGRTGFDATLVLSAGTAGFGNRTGEVWGLHLAWSGDSRTWAERGTDGPRRARRRRAARRPARSSSSPGATYPRPTSSPPYSSAGLDGRRRRRSRLPARADRRPAHPAAGRAQHLGGGLLRPAPRPAHRARRRPRPRSARSASSSTTAGSAAAATTPPAWATGTSTSGSGRTG